MPQICDMGQTALLSLWRKACCGFFFSPEKSDDFGRVRTRDVGYQRPAWYVITTSEAVAGLPAVGRVVPCCWVQPLIPEPVTCRRTRIQPPWILERQTAPLWPVTNSEGKFTLLHFGCASKMIHRQWMWMMKAGVFIPFNGSICFISFQNVGDLTFRNRASYI
jgi:hypothetical protein